MNSQLKRGTLELCVLSIVRQGDCYGYELVQQISEFMHITEGTIYPLLKRLKDDSMITSYIVESSGGPARKYYKLTEQGDVQHQKQTKQWYEFVDAVNSMIGKNTDTLVIETTEEREQNHEEQA